MLQDVLVILIVVVLLVAVLLSFSAALRKDTSHRKLKTWLSALLYFFAVILIVCRFLT
ncbi:hypothetical protein [Bifidobacterium sp. ESL0790]|uniref:hypothetical protein n=1 Tax=Bifidobacterium sp. ESL0790 TaxID=2983233 RepID=UPI0023F862E6|nr:hypothetical protein [Bifidobacterium sp. ESL0790]WEV73131.1 hypothetical protein OZY47_04085 [Bifidobacterium sp. ESL0790]